MNKRVTRFQRVGKALESSSSTERSSIDLSLLDVLKGRGPSGRKEKERYEFEKRERQWFRGISEKQRENAQKQEFSIFKQRVAQEEVKVKRNKEKKKQELQNQEVPRLGIEYYFKRENASIDETQNKEEIKQIESPFFSEGKFNKQPKQGFFKKTNKLQFRRVDRASRTSKMEEKVSPFFSEKDSQFFLSSGGRCQPSQESDEGRKIIDISSSSDEERKDKEVSVIDLISDTSQENIGEIEGPESIRRKQYFYSLRQFAEISQKEISILRSKEFLNDNIIMSYLYYLASSRTDPEIKEQLYICDSILFSKLKTRSMDTFIDAHNFVKRESALFRKKYWLVPICVHSHWLLVIVCFPRYIRNVNMQEGKKKEGKVNLVILDSLPLKNYKLIKKALPTFIAFEYKIRTLELENPTRKQLIQNKELRKVLSTQYVLDIVTPDVPRQTNSYDCGVYLLQTAQFFLQSPEQFFEVLFSEELLYGQKEVNRKREEIAHLFTELAGGAEVVDRVES